MSQTYDDGDVERVYSCTQQNNGNDREKSSYFISTGRQTFNSTQSSTGGWVQEEDEEIASSSVVEFEDELCQSRRNLHNLSKDQLIVLFQRLDSAYQTKCRRGTHSTARSKTYRGISIQGTSRLASGWKQFFVFKGSASEARAKETKLTPHVLAHQWESCIFPDWEGQVHSKLFQKLLARGVPHSVRGRLWSKSIGNSLHMTKSLHEYLSALSESYHNVALKQSVRYTDRIEKHLSELKIDESSSSGFPNNDKEFFLKLLLNTQVINSLEALAADIPRSLDRLISGLKLASYSDDKIKILNDNAEVELTLCKTTLYLRLHRLMGKFIAFRPDIGYVQGMTHLGILLLIYLSDYQAFVSFTNLIVTNSMIYNMYTFDMENMQNYYCIFEKLVQIKMPAVYNQLFVEFEDMSLKNFFVEWVFTLFTRFLPFETLLKTWDYFFLYGDFIIYQVSLATIAFIYRNLQPETMAQWSEILSSSSTAHYSAFDPDMFIKTASDLNLTPRYIEEIKHSLFAKRPPDRKPRKSAQSFEDGSE